MRQGRWPFEDLLIGAMLLVAFIWFMVGLSQYPVRETEATPFSETMSTILGDVSCDGTVTSVDAIYLLWLDVGFTVGNVCIVNADVNGDQEINPVDALLILQVEAGIIDGFPHGS